MTRCVQQGRASAVSCTALKVPTPPWRASERTRRCCISMPSSVFHHSLERAVPAPAAHA